MESVVGCKSGGMELVLSPDPTDAAADGLNHRYVSLGSGETGNKIVANQVGFSFNQSDCSSALISIFRVTVTRSR